MFNLPKEVSQTLCTKDQGVQLCRELREALLPYGIFPALTGGLLYKDGPRKDIDIVLFRHRQMLESFEVIDLITPLSSVGVRITGVYGFVTKATWKGITVDLFNPETNNTSSRVY